MWSCNTQYAKYDYYYKYLFRDANMSQFCSWSSNCATCNNFSRFSDINFPCKFCFDSNSYKYLLRYINSY